MIRARPGKKKAGREPSLGSVTAKKRRGRPPGPASQVRPHRVVTFVTERELRRLNELAEASDSSISAIVHDLLAPALTQTGVQPELGEDEGRKRSQA